MRSTGEVLPLLHSHGGSDAESGAHGPGVFPTRGTARPAQLHQNRGPPGRSSRAGQRELMGDQRGPEGERSTSTSKRIKTRERTRTKTESSKRSDGDSC